MAYLCAENGNLMAIAQQLAQHHQQQTAQQPQNHGHHNLNIYPAATHFLYNTSSGMNINNQWLSPSWTEAQASAGFVPEMVGDLCSTTATTELDLTRAGLFFAEQQPPQSFTDYALMHKPMVMAANNAFRLPELHAFGGFDESPRAAANNEFMAADWMDCLINDEVANNSIVNTAVEACGGISNTAICESTESSEIPYARGSGGCGGGGGDDGSWQSEFCSLGEALRVSSWTETLSEDIISASSVGAGVTLAAAMHDDIKPLVENPKWKSPETTTQVIMKDDGHGQQALDDRHKVVESAASPQLFQSLLDCAKIIDTDRENAQKMISQIKNLANPYGNPTQRIAFYFSDALAIRLNKGKDGVTNDDKCRLLNDVKDGVVTDQEENAKCLEQSIMAYKALNDACPYAKFAHLTANQAILETMESAEKIHIVDFGIVQGVQWAAILQAFATRESGKPRKVKITGIPAPSLGPNPDSALVATGNRLRDFAQLLDLDFEFIPLSCPMSDVEKSMLKVEDDECVAVNFMLQLYHLLGEDSEGILKVLKLAQSLVPKVVTLGEYEANLNSCKFNVRFRNALNYYLAFFDSMEPNMARDSAERGNVEKLFFAEKILGVVAYEGTERKMRLQSRDQWRVLMQSAGFKCLNLSPYAVSQARILLWNYCQTYNLDAACGDFLSLAWNERPLLTVSSWTCC